MVLKSLTNRINSGADKRIEAEGIYTGLPAMNQVDADDGQQHQQGTGQGENKELDCRINLASMPPYADQEKHRDQHHLPEEIEKEEIQGRETPLKYCFP